MALGGYFGREATRRGVADARGTRLGRQQLKRRRGLSAGDPALPGGNLLAGHGHLDALDDDLVRGFQPPFRPPADRRSTAPVRRSWPQPSRPCRTTSSNLRVWSVVTAVSGTSNAWCVPPVASRMLPNRPGVRKPSPLRHNGAGADRARARDRAPLSVKSSVPCQRVIGLVLQADFDRRAPVEALAARLEEQGFRPVELEIDRIHRVDRGQQRGRRRRRPPETEIARIDAAIRDAAGDRRAHGGEARRPANASEPAPGPRRALASLLRTSASSRSISVAAIASSAIEPPAHGQDCSRDSASALSALATLGLRLGQHGAIGAGIDGEERCALADVLTVGEVDAGDLPATCGRISTLRLASKRPTNSSHSVISRCNGSAMVTTGRGGAAGEGVLPANSHHAATSDRIIRAPVQRRGRRKVFGASGWSPAPSWSPVGSSASCSRRSAVAASL